MGRDNVDWSIDKDRKAVAYFFGKNGFEITNNIFGASHLFCVWYSLLFLPKYFWIQLFRKILHLKVIAVITNDITFYPEKAVKITEFADILVAPSSKIYNFFKNNVQIYRIPFFVDPKIFRPLQVCKEEICTKIGIDWNKLENKIVIGSFQRDSLEKDLSKPKWQKNPDLLVKILEKLPKEKFVVLLAGPRRHYIINKYLEKNIDFLFYGDYSYIQNRQDDILTNNFSLETINHLYNLTDIYIVSSKSEGGPKSVLESPLTKTLIFSTDVGLAPDFLHSELIFDENDINSLVDKINEFFQGSGSFEVYVEYNYRKAQEEMKEDLLKEKYKKVILESL